MGIQAVYSENYGCVRFGRSRAVSVTFLFASDKDRMKLTVCEHPKQTLHRENTSFDDLFLHTVAIYNGSNYYRGSAQLFNNAICKRN